MSSPPPELAQFRQTFFAESAEMLADMDGRLERLEHGALDREELDAVFRAVHSIKAGAGMFGYTRLVEFCHGFEAMLDRMRDGRMSVNAAVANLIVRAADALSELVASTQADRAVPAGFAEDISREIEFCLDERAAPATVAAVGASGPRRVRIGFVPRSDMLRHANEPLLLIRELASLGSLTTTCDLSRLPALDDIDPDSLYLSWRFDLDTDVSDLRIREVFEFVEDDAEITIETVAATPSAEDDGFGLWLEPEVSAVATPSGPLAPAAETDRGAGGRPAAQTSIRVDLERVDRLVNMVGELVISQAILKQELAGHDLSAAEGLQAMEALTRDLQDCVMAIRMQPVRSVFARMPRLARDVAGKLGKQVRLSMSGEQTELDKTVIEELSDPLTHMIRNSVDHGIEMPQVRRAAGKPEEGTIRLAAAHVGSNIIIHIEDDGAGINRQRLFDKAVEKGIVAAGTVLSDEEIVDLIFAPGFSTAAAVSDVSGRGVGMDVVRRNIQKIGGRIQVSSVEGRGTRFTLIIPLTLAVLDGMLVAVGAERYILPLTSIIESSRPVASQLSSLPGGQRLAHVRGDYVRLIGLNRVLGVADARDDPMTGLIVLVETATGTRLGLVVDELIGQQQVVIKSLQDNYSPIPGISGGTILGDGNVALILDIEQLGDLQEQNA